MPDPLIRLPLPLQSVILTLESGDLSLACWKFFQLGTWQDLPWIQPDISGEVTQDKADALGAWLWSCYFDAHLFSSSFNEWAHCSQYLIRYLEQQSSWLAFHEKLVQNLQQIYALAISAKAYFLGDGQALNNDRLKKKIDRLRQLIMPSWGPDLHLPLYELPSSNASRDKASSLVDICNLLKGSHPSSGDWLCTSPMALFLALGLESDSFQQRRVICAGLNFSGCQGPLPQLGALKVDSKYHYLSSLLQNLQSSDPLKGGYQEGYAALIKFLENEARSQLFERYGSKGRLQLLYRFQCEDWYQQLSRRDLHLPNDPLPCQLQILQSEVRPRERVYAYKKLPRIVHVCSQIVDESHAPSKILYRLLSLSNTNRFDSALVVTEALASRPMTYPMTLRQAGSSIERAPNFIEFLNRQKTAYYIDCPSATDDLETASNRIIDKLAPLDIDILVFHGPEPIHHKIAAAIEGPVKVLFEHGTLPRASGFDHAICCLEDTATLSGEYLKQLGCQLHILPFPSDARWTWQANFPKKADLGVSDEDVIATTISNHLWQRLSPEFCFAVSEILKACPRMVYMPIGKVEPSQLTPLLERFDPQIHHKIHFLGAQTHPSQLTRCMDFYFNEFPFGSCLGILDAMASGCAVVSMYDPKGPPQARYGGLFVGLDNAITSLDPKDYIRKACELYHDPLKFFIASQQAFQEYEWRSNLWAYVEKFENILASLLPVNRR